MLSLQNDEAPPLERRASGSPGTAGTDVDDDGYPMLFSRVLTGESMAVIPAPTTVKPLQGLTRGASSESVIVVDDPPPSVVPSDVVAATARGVMGSPVRDITFGFSTPPKPTPLVSTPVNPTALASFSFSKYTPPKTSTVLDTKVADIMKEVASATPITAKKGGKIKALAHVPREGKLPKKRESQGDEALEGPEGPEDAEAGLKEEEGDTCGQDASRPATGSARLLEMPRKDDRMHTVPDTKRSCIGYAR